MVRRNEAKTTRIGRGTAYASFGRSYNLRCAVLEQYGVFMLACAGSIDCALFFGGTIKTHSALM